MTNDFKYGVEYFTMAEIIVPVAFPEDKVKCRYCPFCRSESDLGRFWCRITNQMIYNPDYPSLPDGCLAKLTGEIRGNIPKKGAN